MRIQNESQAIHRANEKLSEFVLHFFGPNFLHELWTSIDETIDFKESDIFSYIPDDLSDEFFSSLIDDGERSTPGGALWTFNYFFVNKKTKRIVLFTCVQSMLKGSIYIGDSCDDDREGDESMDQLDLKFDYDELPFC